MACPRLVPLCFLLCCLLLHSSLGQEWVAHQNLPGTGVTFGTSVSIDVPYAVVGAPGSGSDVGFVFVYELVGEVWQSISIAQGPGAFGSSVSLSGTAFVVGAPSDGYGGSVSFFALAGQTLIPREKFVSNIPGNNLGHSVAISAGFAVAGISNAAGASKLTLFDTHPFSSETPLSLITNRGEAWAFQWDSNAWVRTAIILPPVAQSNGLFGFSVGIYESTVIVGEPGQDDNAGRAHIFDIQETAVFVRTLMAAQPLGSCRFGASVAMTDVAAIVGEPGNPRSLAYIFELGNSVWELSRQINGSTSGFGIDVAISRSPYQVVIGHISPGLAAMYLQVNNEWIDDGIISETGFGKAVAIGPEYMLVSGGSAVKSFEYTTPLVTGNTITSITATSGNGGTQSTTTQNTSPSTSSSSVGTTESSLEGSESSGVITISIIAVVAALSCIAIVALVGFFVWRRRREQGRQSPSSVEAPQLQSPRQLVATQGRGCAELDNIERIHNLTMTASIGKGSFGEVYLGDWNGTPCACKRLQNSDLEESIKEASLISKLSHPNIVVLLGIHITEADETFLVFEYVNGGSLLSFLPERRDTLTDAQMLEICIGTAQGMAYLETKKIVHRDLAARNILINEGSFSPKIGDFGLSRDDLYQRSSDSKIPVKWSAPEVLQQSTSNLKSDVFSFGMVLWEIYSFGLQPFAGLSNNQAAEIICNKKMDEKLEQPARCPDEVFQLMIQCWTYNPVERPTFLEILTELKAMRTTGLALPREVAMERSEYNSDPSSGYGTLSSTSTGYGKVSSVAPSGYASAFPGNYEKTPSKLRNA